jgi:hypothetical protein
MEVRFVEKKCKRENLIKFYKTVAVPMGKK